MRAPRETAEAGREAAVLTGPGSGRLEAARRGAFALAKQGKLGAASTLLLRAWTAWRLGKPSDIERRQLRSDLHEVEQVAEAATWVLEEPGSALGINTALDTTTDATFDRSVFDKGVFE